MQAIGNGRRPRASWVRAAWTAGIVGAALVMVPATPAIAACHAFTVEASPSTATEGTSVTVTVSRDAAVSPSQVDVSSVDGTATGDSDFPAVDRTISFTTGTSQSFTVDIVDDAEAEPDETFALHLSNPGGCAVNPNFTLGPDATVTIAASDAPTTTSTTSSQPESTTTQPSSTTDQSASSSAAITPRTSSTAAPSAAPGPDTSLTTRSSSTAAQVESTTSADQEQSTVGDSASASTEGTDSGLPSSVGIAAALVVVAAGLGVFGLWRSRSGRTGG